MLRFATRDLVANVVREGIERAVRGVASEATEEAYEQVIKGADDLSAGAVNSGGWFDTVVSRESTRPIKGQINEAFAAGYGYNEGANACTRTCALMLLEESEPQNPPTDAMEKMLREHYLSDKKRLFDFLGDGMDEDEPLKMLKHVLVV